MRRQHGDGERVSQIGGAGGEIRGGVVMQLLPRGGRQGEEAALEKSRAQFVQRRRARNGDIGNETAGLPVADDGLRGGQRCVGTDEQQQLPPLRRFRCLQQCLLPRGQGGIRRQQRVHVAGGERRAHQEE